MSRRWRHLRIIIQSRRRNGHPRQVLIQGHHDRRATAGTKEARGEITRSPFCRLDVPGDRVLWEEYEGYVWAAGLFATFETMAVDQLVWGCGGLVADVVAGAASRDHLGEFFGRWIN